jgi:hypothetical protein
LENIGLHNGYLLLKIPIGISNLGFQLEREMFLFIMYSVKVFHSAVDNSYR